MNNKTIERIVTIALAAFLVGMFFYQAAHAMTETVGPNGTMTVTGPNDITAILTAPPGSTVSNVTITPLPPMVDLTGTWHLGAAGTITFQTHDYIYQYKWGGSAGFPVDTFTATIGDRNFKGYWDFAQPMSPYKAYLELCGHHDKKYEWVILDCTKMNATIIDDNYIRLSNPDGQSFDLTRNG
jgi:hypothetical protein